MGNLVRDLRVMMLSAVGAVLAPLILAGIFVYRRTAPHVRFRYRHWNKRLQREIARWS